MSNKQQPLAKKLANSPRAKTDSQPGRGLGRPVGITLQPNTIVNQTAPDGIHPPMIKRSNQPIPLPKKTPSRKMGKKESAAPPDTMEARRAKTGVLKARLNRELRRGGIGPGSNQFRGGTPGVEAFSPYVIS